VFSPRSFGGLEPRLAWGGGDVATVEMGSVSRGDKTRDLATGCWSCVSPVMLDAVRQDTYLDAAPATGS
jgi:hypothetical protein